MTPDETAVDLDADQEEACEQLAASVKIARKIFGPDFAVAPVEAAGLVFDLLFDEPPPKKR